VKIWAYVAILALVLGALTGVYHAGRTSERVKHLETLNELENRLESQRLEYENATNSLALAVLNRKTERVVQYEEIIKQVDVLIPDTRSCDIDASLLISARKGMQESKPAASVNAGNARASQGGVTRTAIKWAKLYNEYRDSHNALIERVKKLDCIANE